jgi:outer membrane protein assembly factor BamD
MIKHLLLGIIVLILIAACAQNQQVLTPQEKLAQADELFSRGKYSRAVDMYADLYFSRSVSSLPHVLMRQAECYFRVNRFSDARAVYEEFIETFPNNADISTAYFRTAQCLFEESYSAQYDQTETIHSIDAFKKFVEKYPTDPRYNQAVGYIQKAQYKLIDKKFQTGYIYYKMKDYSSALMYFKEITVLGNSDSLDRKAQYYTTLLLYKQNLMDEARESYQTLKSKYPGSKENQKLAKYFQ